jgi:charged multivesicular body protein 4
VSRETHVDRKIELIVKEAKEKLARGDKKGAVFAMKRKKMYEAECDKIQNVKMTLETQAINLESATHNADTFRAMQEGSNTMSSLRNHVSVDKADDIMDNIREEMELAQEINLSIAQPLDSTDEEALMDELSALEATDSNMLEESSATDQEQLSLPAVPDSKLPSLAKQEEEDLQYLEAALAGL